jgi:hypothetical protein
MSVMVLGLITVLAIVIGGAFRLEFQAATLRTRAQVAAARELEPGDLVAYSGYTFR